MARKATNKKASSRKVGRNIAKCQLYKNRMRQLTNKRRRVAKHLIAHPNDLDAKRSI